MMGAHMTDPVKLTFASATTAGLNWFAQASTGSLGVPAGANCKAVVGCDDTVYCTGEADTKDLTWTPPADSKTGDTSTICVFWGTAQDNVSGQCTIMTSTVAGSVTMPDMSGAACATYLTDPEQKTKC